VRGAKFAGIVLVQIIDVLVEGRSLDRIGAVKNKDDRQPFRVGHHLHDGRQRLFQGASASHNADGACARALRKMLVLFLLRPDLHRKIRVEAVAVGPQADGVPLRSSPFMPDSSNPLTASSTPLVRAFMAEEVSITKRNRFSMRRCLASARPRGSSAGAKENARQDPERGCGKNVA
jgi:hypothetical protein